MGDPVREPVIGAALRPEGLTPQFFFRLCGTLLPYRGQLRPFRYKAQRRFFSGLGRDHVCSHRVEC